ncbi:hypothetical protein [Mannheimia haemolytica]|uniref:hypothetical protein n=1 Tax=Mannheimia haemolytica TaxID=75985 RepID=UPI0001BCF68D|nr:hypothetical protein [Mannheimia haemolytica]EEY10659.1 hypothetical protein COI_0681 [Mannheimia haemolytica serotype A2 str. OVINE]EEY12900.1 hypothetical protein COK_1015 [Mannheimia haemolytica serotype A2 str. BOVINE]MDW0618353.1 hypothetical protein [Mannheimia haemolytica]MDW0624103.1 hypothetical protein [Mannheimia haemolytica]NBB66937.1 hypothetical protein [Mannheimia haemolytica]
MSQITKSAYTHIHPSWQAPSCTTYRIERYELKRRYALFANRQIIVSHIESDVMLLWLLKNEFGWGGNIKQPLSPKDLENLRLLEQAFCLTYTGTFINELSK